MQWRFRWEQWRALPVELRLRKLWQRLCRSSRSNVLIQARGEELAGVFSVGEIPPAEVLVRFREEVREWWEHVRSGKLLLFAPCWVPAPERAEVLEGELNGVRRLFPKGYRYWDWQRDVFSGYRWEGGQALLRRSFPLGIDPKVPWELGRLQFLPALALYAALEGEPAASALLEWGCWRVVDFLLQNPPGLGIHWASPLEVAIRAVSLHVFAGLSQRLQPLEPELRRRIAGSLLEHGRFLMHHLEWNAGLRGNHYLGNVVGLLSIGAALQGVPLADVWLLFGVQELIREVLTQFLPDGGHWEGSVYYHRFVLEMALYGTALVLRLPSERVRALREAPLHLWSGERPLELSWFAEHRIPGTNRTALFPPEYWQRLQAAVRFAVALTKPNGTAPQIGDHDSGRWIKLVPRFVRQSPAEAQSYVLPSGCSAAGMAENARDMRPTLGLAASLCGGSTSEWRREPEAWLFPGEPVCELEHPLSVEVFPDFGVVVYRWDAFVLAVRCGGLERMHPAGGHAHCDQLSIELALGDCDILLDPGTYCYGGSAEWRNRFRSTAAHTTLVVRDVEQFRFFGHSSEALFWLFRRGVRARILHVGEREFVGEFEHPHYRHRRLLRMVTGGVEGRDMYWGSAPFALHFHLAPGIAVEPLGRREMLWRSSAGVLRFVSSAPVECVPDVVSPGYGVLQRSLSVRIAPEQQEEVWWTLECVDYSSTSTPSSVKRSAPGKK